MFLLKSKGAEMNELELTQNGGDLARSTDELGDNPAFVYLASLARGSRRTMIGALGTLAAILTGQYDPETQELQVHGKDALLTAALNYPWQDLRHKQTAALRAQLDARFSAATANKMLSALRRVLLEAWDLELMTEEDRARASHLESVKGETLPAGRSLSAGEIDALMIACADDPTAAGARDGAIVALLYSCGLRRAELAGLTMDDLDADAGVLTIHGKGNKNRLAHVVNGTAAALADCARPGRWPDLLPDRQGRHPAQWRGHYSTGAFQHVRETRR